MSAAICGWARETPRGPSKERLNGERHFARQCNAIWSGFDIRDELKKKKILRSEGA